MSEKYSDPEWIYEKMFGEIDEVIEDQIDEHSYYEELYKNLENNGTLAPLGECEYCDQIRQSRTVGFPSHAAYSFCRSYPGGRNHCTCDTCF